MKVKEEEILMEIEVLHLMVLQLSSAARETSCDQNGENDPGEELL